MYVSAVARILQREFEIRAGIIWQSLLESHRAFGAPYASDLISDLKHRLFDNLRQNREELTQIFLAKAKSRSLGQFNDKLTLNDDAFDIVEKQYDVAADLYCDSLSVGGSRGVSPATTLNFHGAVGVVQTGRKLSPLLSKT